MSNQKNSQASSSGTFLPQMVDDFISLHHLMRHDALYLVALSGGADSVALLLVLRQLGYQVEAIHCNFKLRGDESDRDEQFCADLCERLGVKLHRVHFDTRFYASQHHVSIEMAARELRYNYFARLANEIKAEGVCVAHHLDDSVETILDSTNLETDAVRNKIRLQIMPLFEQINPASKQNIARMSERLSSVADVYRQVIGEDAARVVEHQSAIGGLERFLRISIDALLKVRQPHDTLYHILNYLGFQPAQVEQVWDNLHAETGKMFTSDTYELDFDRGYLVVVPRRTTPFPGFTIPIEGTYHLDGGLPVDVAVADANSCDVSRDDLVATLDADLVSFPLRLRFAEQGDRFQPYGMKGMKLVSDFLTDQKVPLALKRRQMLVEDASGRIVWLVGLRTDQRFCVTSGTHRILTIRVEAKETEQRPIGVTL